MNRWLVLKFLCGLAVKHLIKAMMEQGVEVMPSKAKWID